MKTIKRIVFIILCLTGTLLYSQDNDDQPGMSDLEQRANAMLNGFRKDKFAEIQEYLNRLDSLSDKELSNKQKESLTELQQKLGELESGKQSSGAYFIFKSFYRGRYYWLSMGLGSLKIKCLGKKSNRPLNKGIDYSIADAAGLIPLIIVTDDYAESVTIDQSRSPIILLGAGALIEGVNSSAFQITNTSLYSLVSGFTIHNCSSDLGGAARIINANAVFLLNDVWGNSASVMGGGIFCQNNQGYVPFVVGNIIHSNNAPNGGGLAFNNDFSTVATLNLFIGNHATSGGGVYFYNSLTMFMFNYLNNNTAQNGGGLTIDNSYFTSVGINAFMSNQAQQKGGGIYVTGQVTLPPLICFNGIFDNQANQGGGGIYIDPNSDAIVLLNSISDNFAPAGGGIAVEIADQYTTILANNISHNDADNGGGIWLFDVQNSSGAIGVNRIYSNDATSTGGGICILGDLCTSTISLRNKISENTSPLGGGVFISGLNVPKLIDNEIFRNNADLGAGIFCQGGTVAEFELNQIFENCADDKGGGMFITGMFTNPKVFNTNEFIENRALEGGGIFCNDLCKPLISGNNFYQNLANSGAAIFANAGLFTVIGNIFKWNESVLHGGGIFINPAMNPSITGNQFLTNIAGRAPIAGCGGLDGKFEKTAPANGGAIYVAGDSAAPLINNNYFRQNCASNGGAIAVENTAKPSIISNTFTRNFADRDTTKLGKGGAIYVNKSAPVITGDSVYWNYAAYGGGIACVNGAKPRITSSNFRWNVADYKLEGKGIGGAIFVSGDSTEPVIGVPGEPNLFKENIAEQGGAIAVDSLAFAELKSNIFFSNHTDYNNDGIGNGGAVFATDAGTELMIGGNAMDDDDNLFEYNTAGSPEYPGMANGGAIAAVQGAVLSILGNIFDNRNACTNNGAAVYLEGSGTYALIGGQNDDEIINTPLLNPESKEDWEEQFGNIIKNNNRSLKKYIDLPGWEIPQEEEPDTVPYTYDEPPLPPDTTEIPHYEPVRDSYITTIQTDILPPDKYVYITENSGGLKVINVTNPYSPGIIANFLSNDLSTDVAYSANHIFLADGYAGVRVFDKSPMYSGMPPTEIYTLNIPEVSLAEIEADNDYLYVLGSNNTIYLGRIMGYNVELTGTYTPANPAEVITGIHAGNEFLYITVLNINISFFRVTKATGIEEPYLEPYGQFAFINSTINDVDIVGFHAYVVVQQKIGDIYQTNIRLLDVANPNQLIQLPFNCPFVLNEFVTSVSSNGIYTYLTLNEQILRYQEPGMVMSYLTTSLCTSVVQDGEFLYVGNTGEGFQIYIAETMEPVMMIVFPPLFKEEEIMLYPWVEYPPENFTMDLPVLPDTVVIDGVPHEIKSPGKQLYNLVFDLSSCLKNLTDAGLRSTDTLITINGGFLAVVDSAETRVLGNFIGGDEPLDANFVTEYGGGIYVNNAGTMVNIGENAGKSSDQKNFIVGNLAKSGGGIALVNHTNTVDIRNNIIGGSPEFHSNVANLYGGGIYSNTSNSVITNNVIMNNYAGIEKDRHKFERGLGGGMALDSSNTLINENWIIDNFSFGNAGGIAIVNGKTTLKYTTITENKSIRAISRVSQQAQGLGDDLYAEDLTDSCIITKNIFDHVGSFEGYSVYIDTLTSPGRSKLVVSDNNAWNTTGKRFGGFATDPTGTNGNISVNPLFVDPENDDYNLDVNSPANGMGWNPEPGNTVVGDTTYFVPDDYSTITQAMSAAIYGDIIKVRKNYNSQAEPLPITVKSGVHLTGLAFKEDSLNLNLIPETMIAGNPNLNIFNLDSTDNRTIIAGLRMTGADTAISIRDGSAFIYGNIFDSISQGIRMKYADTIMPGFRDKVFIDHNTFSSGHITMEYDSAAASWPETGVQKMYHGPVISYNIGSVICNIDSIQSNVPFHIVFEVNDFWPNGITGCNQNVYGLSTSNFQQDPLFQDEPNDDFHLKLNSPCLVFSNYTYLVGAQYQYFDVDFTGSPLEGMKPLQVTFTDNSGFAWPPLKYYWDFGDGNSSTNQNPVHQYADTGYFDVAFTVKDWYAYKTKLKTDYIHVLVIRQDLGMPAGWSGVSTNIIPDPVDVESMFSPINDKLIILFNLSGMLWPGQNINTLGDWDVYSGYVIKVNQDANLTITGNALNSRTVSLSQGWNLIPVFTQSSATTILGGIPGFVVAKGVANIEVLWPAYNIATLQTLATGCAYWVYTTQAGSITYPDAKSTTPTIVVPPEYNIETPWNDLVLTPYTHLVAFTQECLQALSDGDIIAGFNTAGFCNGATVISGNNPPVLVLNGDDPTTEETDGFTEGEPMLFKCYRESTGEIIGLEVTWDLQLSHSGKFETNGLSAITVIRQVSSSPVEFRRDGFKIIPNPSGGTFAISGLYGEYNVTIVSIVGNKIFEKDLTLPAIIDLTSEPVGVYVINVKNSNHQFFKKLILE